MSALPIPTLPETLTTPDDDLCSPWQSYEARKRELQAADLPADEYEAAIAELVEELGV